jgi:hypothetical protein
MGWLAYFRLQHRPVKSNVKNYELSVRNRTIWAAILGYQPRPNTEAIHASRVTDTPLTGQTLHANSQSARDARSHTPDLLMVIFHRDCKASEDSRLLMNPALRRHVRGHRSRRSIEHAIY